MEELLKSMQAEFERKYNELTDRQLYLNSSVTNDINSGTFERNLIGDLIITNDLKVEINQLKRWIQTISMQIDLKKIK